MTIPEPNKEDMEIDLEETYKCWIPGSVLPNFADRIKKCLIRRCARYEKALKEIKQMPHSVSNDTEYHSGEKQGLSEAAFIATKAIEGISE